MTFASGWSWFRMGTFGLATLALGCSQPATAQNAGENKVCGPGILRADGSFDLARIGPLIAGSWTEKAYGLSVAKGLQSSVFVIVHDATRGRIYVQADGTQIPLKIVRGERRESGWDFPKNRPIKPEELVLDRLVGGFRSFLEKENCDWAAAPQFSWEHNTPRGKSAGYLTFISPNAGIGVKWNDAMGSREQLLTR
jgi:hypothetical protein